MNYLSGSDFLEAYEVGAERQAKALGIHVHLWEAQQDPDKLRSLVQQAIDLHVQGIVINNATKQAVRDVVQRALAAGIKVVTNDLDLGLAGVPVVEQDDREMANIVLAKALADEGDHFHAGEVYVAGFLPLDHRHAAFRAFGGASRHQDRRCLGRRQQHDASLGHPPDGGGVPRASRYHRGFHTLGRVRAASCSGSMS